MTMKRFFTTAVFALVGVFACTVWVAQGATITYQQSFAATGTQASDSGTAFAGYSGWTYYEPTSDAASYASVDSAGTLSLIKGATRGIYSLVTAKSITGADAFDVSTGPTTISAEMTGVGTAGNFHVGLVFGNAELYFHPGYPGGAVRIGPVGDMNGNFFNNFGDVGQTFAQNTMTKVSVTLVNDATNSSVYDANISVGSYFNTVQLSKSAVGSLSTAGLLVDGDAGSAQTGLFSNFTVSTISTVPEPGMLHLVGIGVTGLLAYAWRKRR